MGFFMIISLVPAMTANAATGVFTPIVTSSIIVLSWTMQPGETTVQIYQNGIYIATVANTNNYPVSGLSPCTSYYFEVRGTGSYSSTSTPWVSTTGCS